jgi:hypothetical protein
VNFDLEGFQTEAENEETLKSHERRIFFPSNIPFANKN